MMPFQSAGRIVHAPSTDRESTMPARSYADLDVWQVAMDLVDEVYAVSRRLPREERWGLTSQLRRAVISVPANIAEGNSRPYRRDYIRFLAISAGSLHEVETYLHISVRQQYVDAAHTRRSFRLSIRVGYMLIRLMHALAGPAS